MLHCGIWRRVKVFVEDILAAGALVACARLSKLIAVNRANQPWRMATVFSVVKPYSASNPFSRP